MPLPPKLVLRVLSYWPPYLASGIRVESVAEDLTSVTVSLTTRPWNQNYFGTHFGGSLYAMCDPFFVFILAQHLGKDHIVWDKAAEIQFLRAVTEPVRATFTIPPARIAEIRAAALEQFSVEPQLSAEIVTAAGRVVARVQKILYVRRKDAKERFARR